MSRLFKLDESLVSFVKTFVKAIDLTLPGHLELAAKLLESFTINFCEMGHSPYIGQAIFKGFRQYLSALFSEHFRFKGKNSIDVFSGADALPILWRACERVLFGRGGIGSFNVRVSQMKVNTFDEDIRQEVVDIVLTLRADFWNIAVGASHEHHLQKKIEHNCLLGNFVAYILGQCSMICVRSIRKNQHERDNGFMVEQAGGGFGLAKRSLPRR
jgi:hypothetical protein